MAVELTNSGTYIELPWNDPGKIPFLEKYFPWQCLVLIPLMRRILPRELFLLFYAWKKETLWERLFEEISTALGETVVYRSPTIVHAGPQYYAYTVSVSSGDTKGIYGHGQSLVSGDEALSKALGEFLERYSLHVRGEIKGSITATRRKLGASAVDLNSFPLYEAWQKRETNSHFITKDSSDSTSLKWVKAQSLIGTKSAYIPAQRVFWRYKYEADEWIINQGTTSGSGGGFTKTQATLSAAFEIIERDSFMCHWLLKIPPRQIDPVTIKLQEVAALQRSVEMFGGEVHYFDVTTALGVPAIATFIVIHDRDGKIRLGMGALAGFSPKKLFLGSLMEASTVTNGVTKWDKEILELLHEAKNPFTNRKLNRGARLVSWRNNGVPKSEISWLFSGEVVPAGVFDSERALSDPRPEKEELSTLKSLFKEWVNVYGVGYEPYVYEPLISRSKISYFGYRAVSVVVPSLYPLYLNEHMANLDVSMLKHWKDTLAKAGRVGEEPRIVNTLPHPFP